MLIVAFLAVSILVTGFLVFLLTWEPKSPVAKRVEKRRADKRKAREIQQATREYQKKWAQVNRR